MRKVLPALSFFLMLVTAAATLRADDKPMETKIGDTKIVIPAPPGFVNVHEGNDAILSVMQKLTPESNKLITGFVQPEVAKVKDGSATLNKYMMVQYAASIETVAITPTDFKDVKASVAQQDLAKIKDDVNARLKEVAEGKLEVGKPTMLDAFIDQDNASAFGMIAKYSSDDGKGGKSESKVVGGGAFVLVKDKVLFLYVYCIYDGNASVDWMKNTTKAWTDAVIKANQ